MTILESKVQQDVMKRLRKLGCYVYKNAQNMYTEKGRPDLTACVPVKMANNIRGLFVGIELKRPGHLNGVSEAQEVVGRAIVKAGGIWILSDNADCIEKYIKFIQESNYDNTDNNK